VSELPLSLQLKLLRVIEDKDVRPLGATKGEKVDVRIHQMGIHAEYSLQWLNGLLRPAQQVIGLP
jgi:hypothetical protein